MKVKIYKHLLTASLILIPFSASALISSCTTTHRQESTGQYLDSSVITAKIKAEFLKDNVIKSYPITVNTYKNVVQLSGFVDNRFQRDRAGDIARSVEGVAEVKNSLVIKHR